MLWGIDWYLVQKMIIDAPKYDTDDDDEKKPAAKATEYDLKEQSSEDMLKILQKHL